MLLEFQATYDFSAEVLVELMLFIDPHEGSTIISVRCIGWYRLFENMGWFETCSWADQLSWLVSNSSAQIYYRSGDERRMRSLGTLGTSNAL